MKKELTYIDLFCGAGGMSLGFDEVGFKQIFSIDKEKVAFVLLTDIIFHTIS